VQVGPSPVIVPARLMGTLGGPPHELTVGEIAERVKWFAAAARRAKEAGFDGVELNAASCHLLNSFLSRVWNKRQDAYGCGNLECPRLVQS
jgi:2,4-dienoyl-CoA reductase-like NADH-dependent reductase (Old Yellow Enzyme family)